MASRNLSLIVKLPLPKKLAENKSATVSSSTNTTSAQSPKPPSNQDILHHFTKSHLGLALAIQKSKPVGLSVREYCEQLRICIKNGNRGVVEQPRYVDTTEFWKDRCEKMHLEKTALKDKLRCVEESNRLLRQALQTDGAHSKSEESIASPGLDGAVSSTSPKRPSSSFEEEFLEEAAPITIPSLADDNLLRLSSYIHQLKRQHLQLEEACKESNTIDQINNLTEQIVNTLALLGTPLLDSCSPSILLKTNSAQKNTLTILWRVISYAGVSFHACFRAFNELCRTIPGRLNKSKLVFQMVMIFGKSLNFLKELSDLQAAQEDTTAHRGRRIKRARVDDGEYVVNKYLANMLSSIAYGLEWEAHQPGHGEFLEGILYSVLEHTGRLLSEAVFQEHVAISDNPGNVSEGVLRGSKEAARIEARYIVQILHATLGGDKRKDLVAHILSSRGKSAGQSRLSSTANVLSGDLLLKAKKLLQSTLMKTAVGGEGLETLRLPTPPLEGIEVVVPEVPVIEQYGSDWLVETVWALIGWDVMA